MMPVAHRDPITTALAGAGSALIVLTRGGRSMRAGDPILRERIQGDLANILQSLLNRVGPTPAGAPVNWNPAYLRDVAQLTQRAQRDLGMWGAEYAERALQHVSRAHQLMASGGQPLRKAPPACSLGAATFGNQITTMLIGGLASTVAVGLTVGLEASRGASPLSLGMWAGGAYAFPLPAVVIALVRAATSQRGTRSAA